MAASGTVQQPKYLRKFPISKSGVLTLSGFGIKVRVQSGHLELEDGVGMERRRFRLPRVGHGLRRLVVIGSDGFVSLSALDWLASQKASFVMLERNGKVLATTGPVCPSDARLRRAQALAHSSGAALLIAKELISRKLAGQEQVARHRLLDSQTADRVVEFREELTKADSLQTVSLLESQAAADYWGAYRNLPINFPRKHEKRIPERWLTFGNRASALTGSPRRAVNPANAILNYLYALLEAESRLALNAVGLDPGIGILHVDTPNRDSLACDLMEAARPQVDAYLVRWVTTETLRREWFIELPDGTCRLTRELTAHLSETAPMWARAVAPVAEWLAQAFWDSTRSKGKYDSVPTRLTHRRRVEGRGRECAPRPTLLPKHVRVCERCGEEGVRSRYCRSCALEVARENMARVALIGHSKPRSLKVRAHLSSALSDHAVANSWWSPSSLPSWLTEEFYVQKIQPQLRTWKVREIAHVMHISKPYAALIRSGKRRAHSRHWQTLAKLVSATPL